MTAAVTVESVSKRFRLYHERNQSLKAALMRKRRAVVDEFWALQDVSFEVPEGTTFGLIGENGSGKSTMMKCMAKILRPDSGKVSVEGKVSALLELGAGFHPELSGRENVFLNGSILGISQRELVRRFDEIVDYADLPSGFIDQPVKNYSSGMYVRLGFSVAINVDPDVLLVDEVLAVGDEAFQRKCGEKFAQLREQGKTIVLVSHSMVAVHNLCDKVAWLDHGKVKMLDEARKVVDEYTGTVQADSKADVEGNRWGSHEARIEAVELLNGAGTPLVQPRTGDTVTVRLHYDTNAPIERPVFAVQFLTVDGHHVSGPNTRDAEFEIPRLEGRGHIDLDVDRLMLTPGTYDITAALLDHALLHTFDYRTHVVRFHVEPGEPRESYGVMSLGGRWKLGQPGSTP